MSYYCTTNVNHVLVEGIQWEEVSIVVNKKETLKLMQKQSIVLVSQHIRRIIIFNWWIIKLY